MVLGSSAGAQGVAVNLNGALLFDLMGAGSMAVLGDALGSLAASAGRLVEGGVADICAFDPTEPWTVGPDTLISQGQHTPFAYSATGTTLVGRVQATWVAGSLAFQRRA